MCSNKAKTAIYILWEFETITKIRLQNQSDEQIFPGSFKSIDGTQIALKPKQLALKC